MSDVDVRWIDHGREPQCEPNPDFPHGCHIDVSDGAAMTCTVTVGYPAKRCGAYLLKCRTCDYSALITTAGRPDDPRSVKLPCHGHEFYPQGMTKVTLLPKKTPAEEGLKAKAG